MTMWDGRFSKKPAELMRHFNDSLPVDKALIEEDIAGSIAWAKALCRARVLTAKEQASICAGLARILRQYESGKIRFASVDEDIHMAVERILTDEIGDAGAKLHTGRSRNDQVATDCRMYTKKSLGSIYEFVGALQAALYSRAKRDRDIVAPAYTHLQQAQPISLAHYWLSFFFALEREKKRLAHAIDTADEMPLGAGAVAGSGVKVDRRALAKDLGFSRISDNSIDAVASRDFVLEALAALCSLGVLMSRYAEDLIIWSSREFGFVELDDAWSTGSSMMPQKKNPDSLELLRGKSGRLIANHTRCATGIKGVGLAYYKDLQEDKEPLIDSVTQSAMMLQVFANVCKTLQVRRERVAADLDPLLFATDLADYLTRKGMPFRSAHKVVGAIVKQCVDEKMALSDMTLAELRQHSALFQKDVRKVFLWESALMHRDIEGGTGPTSIIRQLARVEKILQHSHNQSL